VSCRSVHFSLFNLITIAVGSLVFSCVVDFILYISGSQFSEFYSKMLCCFKADTQTVDVNLRFAAYVCKRVGKLTLSAIGGGVLVLQVQNKKKCIFFNSLLEPFR